MKKSLSLKFKIVIGFLAVGLIPSIGLEVNSMSHARETQAELDEGFKNWTLNIADKVDRNLFERYGDVQAFGFNAAIFDATSWYKPGPESNPIVAAMNNYVVAYGMYYITTLVDLKGNVIAVNDVNREGKPIDTKYLYEQNHADKKWFQDSLAGKFYTEEGALSGTVVENTYIDDDVKKVYGDEGISIGFSAPVKDPSGKVIAVWKNTARFDLVEAVIKDSSAVLAATGYKKAEIILVDHSGVLLAKYAPATSGSADFARNMREILKLNLAESGEESFKDAVSSEEGVRSDIIDSVTGERMVVAHSKLQGALGFIGMPWSVVIREPYSELHDHDIKATNVSYIIFGVAIVGITLSAILFGRYIALPIERIIVSLQQGSRELRSAASQVASSSQSLAQGATEQAASLEESAASLEEVASVSKHNTDNSHQAQNIAESVRAAADTGVQNVTEMTAAIQAIKKSADETAQIVKIIDEIAFQTNLLALNAAVEAARAGDAGKGFAVVAEEVRNLAQRSANAAKESSEKIRQSTELADNGVRITADVAQSLGTINENAVKSAELMREIAASGKEQTTGITQINQAVTELDKVTQQNSAAAEESSAAAEELTAQATTLDEVVQNLSQIIYGQLNNARTAASVAVSQSTTAAKKDSKTQTTKVTMVTKGVAKKGDHAPSARTPTQIIPLDDQDFQGF